MPRQTSLRTIKVKDLAFSNDIDFVGVAPVARFENAPEGHKPTDLLPGAKSVVSMGMQINLGVQLAQRIAWANRKRLRHVKTIYRRFGYGVLNEYFNDRAAFQLTQMLEGEGYVAVPIVGSGVESQWMGAISNRHAAVAAGMGEFGYNGLCVTPEVGPRARFVSVITTAELDPTPLYGGPKLCDLEKCKQLGEGQPFCARVCPVKGFSSEESNEVIIGGRKFNYARLDKHRCLAGSYLNYLGFQDLKIPSKVDQEVLSQYQAQMHPQEIMEGWSAGRGHGCGLCLLRCPVGASAVLDEIMEEVQRTRGEEKRRI